MIDERITQMAAKGKNAIDERELAWKTEKEEEYARNLAAWQERQDLVRLAFPEELRAYVTCLPGEDDIQRSGPEGNAVRARIEIPGFAQISAYGEFRNDQGFTLMERNVNYQKQPIFSIPAPETDYEDGSIIWSYYYRETTTNDLNEALAYAQANFAEFQERVEDRKERLAAKAAEEPIYTAMDTDEATNPFMDELVKLIRDVARFEMAVLVDHAPGRRSAAGNADAIS